MPSIPVTSVPSISSRPSIADELSRRLDAVRQRAFDRFVARGAEDGHDLDDWIAAERDVLGWPAAELKQRNGKYEVEVALAGFDPSEVDVTVADDEIVVHAASKHESESRDGDVVWTEFGSNDVFRRFVLDKRIDRDAVAAQMEDGLLRVHAPIRATRAPERSSRASTKHKVRKTHSVRT